MSAKSTVDLSIVIAAHTEGLIAHKTIRSIERAVNLLKQRNVRYEILATLDRADKATLDYFTGDFTKAIKVFPVDFGDLAACRNFGVATAQGTYVAFVDADDLVSEEWFLRAYDLAANSADDVVIHTEYSVNFGTQSIVWHKYNSLDRQHEALINVQANRWDSAIIARKVLLQKFPYEANLNGFGSEDWHFNSQTIAAGVRHLVAPQTALFVRRKDVSEMTIQRADRRTVHYTNLLDFDFFRSLDAPALATKAQPTTIGNAQNTTRSAHVSDMAKHGMKLIYRAVRRTPLVRTYAVRAKEAYVRRMHHAQIATLDLPEWLYQEWKALQTLEQQLFPTREVLQRTSWYYSEMYELGVFYWRLVQHTSKYPTYIIFVPYLKKGGADLFALNYANTLAEGGVSVLVVATQADTSDWRARLDKRVDFLPFGVLADGLPKDLQLQILMRFIIQSRAKALHILQSPLGYDLVETYKAVLARNNFKIFCSAYCDDVDQEGHIAGYIHTGLPRIYEHVSRIFTDNTHVIDQLYHEYAFDRREFKVHHQPILPPKLTRPAPKYDGKEFLWAGRIAKQKRPDLLIQIAQQLEGTEVKLDVYGSFQDGYDQTLFENISTIRYMGEFDSFFNLPYQEYTALLYTSERDGLPNILLEAASVALPAIAPSVGGITDFVTPSTGILIQDNTDVQAYAEAVRALAENPSRARELGYKARGVVSKEHSVEAFQHEVMRDIKCEVI